MELNESAFLSEGLTVTASAHRRRQGEGDSHTQKLAVRVLPSHQGEVAA